MFENEKFAISTFQAISLATIVGIISQIGNLKTFLELWEIKILLHIFTISVTFSVLAAYYKHEYKKWDVKLPNSDSQKELEDRSKKMNYGLEWMRKCMLLSVVTTLAGFHFFIISIWLY